MKNILFIHILFLMFVSNLGFGQVNDFKFRKLSPPGGFALDGIKTIIQDDLGYMWMATSEGLIKYNSQHTTWFTPIENDTTSIPSEKINHVSCDGKCTIWLSTDKGLSVFDRSTQSFKTFSFTYDNGTKCTNKVLASIKTEDDQLFVIDEDYFGLIDLETKTFNRIGPNRIKFPSVLYKDHYNQIWIGTLGGEVFRYFHLNNEVEKVFANKSMVNCIYSESDQIWIGTEGNGANLFSENGELLKQVSFSENDNTNNKGSVRVIKKDTYGRMWFGAYEGLFMDNGKDLVRFKPDNYPGLPHNSIYEIFEDQQGGLWFGTWSGGVALIHHSDNNFQTFRHSLSSNSISDNTATAMAQLNNNELLIGTELGGLNTFNINTARFQRVQLAPGNNIQNIKALCIDNFGGIWVGTFREGLFYRAPGSTKFDVFNEGPNDGKHISSTNVHSFCAVDSGIWIGTFFNGVNFYSYKTKSIRHCFLNNKSGIDMSKLGIHSIIADSKSNLWLGTVSGVLYKINLPTGNIIKYEREQFAEKHGNIAIYHLWEHSSGNIWVASNNIGLQIFNPASETFTSFDADGFLIRKSVYGIIEDNKSQIWITSNNGLVMYNPENELFSHFVYSDGIQSNLFYPKSVLKDHTGILYFGGPNGFTRINPATIKTNTRKPYTVINQLTTKDNNKIYPTHVEKYKYNTIKLGPQETTFRVNFSANNYLLPEKNKYQYRLINYYDDWINNNNEGSVLFTSLKAGTYIFEVKACNNDGVWNDTPVQMKIIIANYWYKTKIALFIYFLLFASFLYFIGRFYFERILLKQEITAEKRERENEEQLHEMKLKFFTNISHEFRTPLTLISWPLKKLLHSNTISEEEREELEVAQRNSNRLLQLINQVVDIRKLEKEKNKLNISKIDLIEFIKEMQLGFVSEGKKHEIDFQFDSPYSALNIEADKEKLDAILYNLLANAYKYVSLKGKIKITVNKQISSESNTYSNQLSFGGIHVDDFVEIAIEDNGSGIEHEDLLRIFTRFEQGKQSQNKSTGNQKGSGIGLSMCKDFTILHHGKITVQSNTEKGSRFTLLLPLKQKAQKILSSGHQKVKNLNSPQATLPSVLQESTIEKKTKILIIEDNADFRKFIAKFLNEFYIVYAASNGKQALNLLKDKNFDLIVSDVMMPEMDGFEFCSLVKTQIETSHIPVILLTALSSSENLIAGLDKGADAYLTKPFDQEVLLKQIENILEQRQRIKENFSNQFIDQKTVEVSSLDNFFLNRVRDVVEKNITEENFSIEVLADELMISRSKLHRKIKSLSGLTTTDFVNLVRIKKAVELITKEDYRFNEVAFQVGFSSQSYFNRCFKKVYKVTPKAYFDKLEKESSN